jgi:hypothetical protein
VYGSGTGGTGGSGIGGNGGTLSTAPTAPITSSGGGGGGAGGNNVGVITSTGASGVVIMRIPTAVYTGTTTGSPTVTTDGAFTVVKWVSSGSYTA